MSSRYQEIKDQVRYVETAHDDYDLDRFPDFMIIGPHRTGTTWLHERLVMHPEVFLPDCKEVHFFNHLEEPEYRKNAPHPVEQELGWYLDQFDIPDNYWKTNHCRDNYGCEFNPRMVGDGSATYAVRLHEGIIREIVLLNPDIKIITMVRDPIQRAWSAAKMNLSRDVNRPIDDISDDEWVEFVSRNFQQRTGHYSSWHPNWVSNVPAENLMIGRFIDITQDPVGLLRRAFRFLGIEDDERFIPKEVTGHVNRTDAVDIPARVLARLHELFDDEIERLRAADMI